MPKPPTTKRDWMMSSLGERIAHICELRGWSLNKLGEEAGIASGPMSRMSRRTEVTAGSPDTLKRIADAGGVSVLWLMFGRGPVETGSHHPKALRNHPDWPAALAEAKRRQRGIPEEFWILAGGAVLGVAHVDWQLIVGLVREMYSAHQRGFDTDDEDSGGR
ncbi:MAG: helix-turn-helix transcriptional regulator [Minicystis sp.]